MSTSLSGFQSPDVYLKAVLETVVDAIVTIDEQGHIESVNPAVERLFGYDAGELLGRNVSVLMPEHYADHHNAYVRGYISGGPPRIIGKGRQVQGRRRDGSVFPLDLAVSETRVEGRRVFVGIMRDISRRQAVEYALAREQALLKSLIDSIPDLIFCKDTAGSYINSNRAFNALVDRQGDLRGATDYDLFPREVADFFRDMDRRMMTTKQPRRNEEWVTYPDGREVLLDTLKTPFYGPDGENLGLIGISRDITRQRRIEEDLRLRDRAMAAADNGILITDMRLPDQPLVYINPAFETITGYRRDEVLGRNCRFLQGDERGQPGIDTLRQALRDGSSCRVTLKNFRKDGSAFWNALTISPVHSEAGELTHFIGIQTDISEQVESEEYVRQMNDMLEDLVEERTHSLSAAEEQYRTIFENAVEGIFQSTPDGRYLVVNPALARIYGYDSAEQLMTELDDIGRQLYVEPDRRADFLRRMAQEGRVTHFEARVRRRDGEIIWVSENCRRVDDEQGRVRYFEGTVEDVTQRVLAEQALRKSEQRFRTLIEQAADAFYLHDPQGKVVDVNQRACESLGYTREELLAMRVCDIETNPEAEDLAPMIQQLRQGQAPTLYGNHRRKDGSTFPVEVRPGYINNDQGEFVLCLARDISDRRAYEARLEYQANHDDLTDLPNRNLLSDRLAHALASADRSGQAVAVLFLDLDRFKTINDSFGHSLGDELLKAVAERLKTAVRQYDTVARLGADEYVVVLEGLERNDTSGLMAAKLLDVMKPAFTLEGQEVFLGASLGVSLYPKDGKTPDQLLKNAHAAMYRAKEKGRNTVQFYTAELNARSRERLTLESRLRYALEKDDELLLMYQPQVDLRSGKVIGAEALIRWRQADGSMISPGEFIPLAEETGLILPMGEWVLHTACAQAKALRDQGLPALRMAVNLSPRQFGQSTLFRVVEQALSRHGLSPDSLELEITESLLMQDVSSAIRTLKNFKDMGVHLAIDDFGTGYSSLNYLKRFPIDRLKIDRSFVRDVTTDPDDAAIALAVVAMAHSLRLGVVAEGVETQGQLTFLRTRRCDEMQGFYFSKPLPDADLMQLLREGRGLDLGQDDDALRRDNTLLLVDDEPTTTAVVRQLLQQQGYEVLVAHNAREGFDLLARRQVAVVISDEVMPEMNGTQFLERVRELYPETVRIMLSGRSNMRSLVGAINRGAIFRFLDKPVDRHLLVDTVREAFLLHEVQGQESCTRASA